MTTQIVPHGKAKGTDFCGAYWSYIVRSDLRCYMRSPTKDFHEGRDNTIRPLHPSCSEGDHYMAYLYKPATFSREGGMQLFFVIKGDKFRRVTDLTADTNAVTGTLHEKCQKGDFYLAAPGGTFIIIFAKAWKYTVVSDLKTARGEKSFRLDENCTRGLYYWASADDEDRVWYHLVKQDDTFGVQMHHTTDLRTDANARDESFNASVMNFIPGGVAVTMGPAFGVWEPARDAIVNNTNSTYKETIEISRKIGSKKAAFHSVQHNWDFKASASTEIKGGIDLWKLTEATLKQQFSFEASYGGKLIDTTQEDWSEEHTVKKITDVTIKPGESMHFWRFKLGFKKGEIAQDVLYPGGELRMTKTATKPTDIPLASAISS